MKRFLSMMVLVVLLMTIAMPVTAVGETLCDKLGHNWVRESKKSPTCTEEGAELYKCRICGTPKKTTLNKLGHEWEEAGRQDATCTKNGVSSVYCTRCGEEDNQTIKKLGHNYKAVEVTKQATCQTAGEEKIKCSRCGDTDTRKTEKSGHVYGEWTISTEATDNAKGVRSGFCIHCGKERTEDYYPEGTMYRGVSDKESVMVLQSRLTDCGYLNDKIDGIFGGKTEQAVKDFQTQAGINADGIAWPETNKLLEKAWLDLNDSDVACCTRIENEDGALEYLYCEEHIALMNAVEALFTEGASEEDEIDALIQVRQMYEEEVDKLYGDWLMNSAEEDKPSVTGAQAMFAGYLNTQEMVWNKQFGVNSLEALTKINEMLHDQWFEMCSVLEIIGAEAAE